MNSQKNPTTKQIKPDWLLRAHKQLARTRSLLDKDIWELEYLGRRSARARIYLLLRILTLTLQGLRRNKLPVQSAALTFYSLIGIGPLIALGIMISSFVMDQSPTNSEGLNQPTDNRAVEWIENAISYAAPQLSIDTDVTDDLEAELAPEHYAAVGNRDILDAVCHWH